MTIFHFLPLIESPLHGTVGKSRAFAGLWRDSTPRSLANSPFAILNPNCVVAGRAAERPSDGRSQLCAINTRLEDHVCFIGLKDAPVLIRDGRFSNNDHMATCLAPYTSGIRIACTPEKNQAAADVVAAAPARGLVNTIHYRIARRAQSSRPKRGSNATFTRRFAHGARYFKRSSGYAFHWES
ncbi:unnamed protein product, partial [Iphiclides podalirius]